MADDLESNAFFKTLQTKYANKYEIAQQKSWVICVPCHSSLSEVHISEEFIDDHILKPSPFFKSHYTTTDINHSKSFEFEDASIITPGGTVKILMEELGYNEDYKPFKIFIVERPLNYVPKEKIDYKNGNNLCTEGVGVKISSSDCRTFLQSFPQHAQHLNVLDIKIKQFCSSYMVLPDYLHDAALKLQDLVNWATEAFTESHKYNVSVDESVIAEVATSLENYILSQVHSKLFPVIKKKCLDEDKKLTYTLFSLYEAGLTADQLGVREPFCSHTPSAVVELASLNSKISPAEKLLCLMTTLELLNQDIETSLQETYSPVTSNKDIPCMTSDDLIPLLVTVLVQARPQYLGSNLYYIQNFCWQLSIKDKLSFSLVTFQAAKEFLKSNEISCPRTSSVKIKKEMSLEELMVMTVEIQKSTREHNSETKPQHNHSPIDHQLENVTKMIEASTREFREWSQLRADTHSSICAEEKDSVEHDELGGFLSNLQQSSLGFSYGKQT